MPDLHNDIIGQVARLPLKPSEASSLLPLYEAISNALHAVTDRFGDAEFAEKGRIDIKILRGERKQGDEDADVIGFVIEDNGIGLNEENYQSFCTPFSRHKLPRGGKGVGRIGWLKVFDRIEIASRYQNGAKLKAIEFAFVLREHNQIDLKDASTLVHKEPGTIVQLSGFRDSYGTRCPAKTDTILQRIIGHFLPVFAGDKSPRIFLHDDAIIDVRDQFRGKIRASLESKIGVEIDSESHPINVRHMRCDKSIRPRGQNYNWLCFCAHDRGVKEFKIDDQLGLHKLDNDEIYVGAVTGDYLDSHVNPQRTDFIFDAEEGKLIRRQVADSIRDFLKDPIEQMLARKKSITTEVIKKNPQYMYLSGEIDELVSSLKPNATSGEQIYVEMAQHKYRRQRKFSIVKKDIDRAPNYSDSIAQQIDEYRKYILDDKK
jgi:histidine kinase/DNA gyrase B/HSP90-like ATPase